MKIILAFFPLLFLFLPAPIFAQTVGGVRAEPVANADNAGTNFYYVSNRQPLIYDHFVKLPVTAFKPGGWLARQLELQRDGLTGHLGEISVWLSKKDNAWLSTDGKGKWGWEELPYWLKGYANIGYMLNDPKMIRESLFWINHVLSHQRPDGDFGPAVEHSGKRDLWTNMPMLWCLQSYYEYSGDRRVIPFMTRYFKWELSVPDSNFLKDYWENSRGGDNLYSVYWLYDRTRASWLLDLAKKIDRNTADWRQKENLPNWHNVNVAQCFREPAEFWQQSHDKADMAATYNDFRLVRDVYGQVPGGLFGADENARKGYDDPRQCVETCGMVEQMTSDQMLLRSTGDTRWAENCEDVAFNTFPAAFMPDYKSLRYLTAPNMVVSDSKDHSPGIANSGPFLMMNPFSSRCCQHNHAAGWVYYAENCWMATPDNGLVAQLYSEGTVTAWVGNPSMAVKAAGQVDETAGGYAGVGGTKVRIVETTKYPFRDIIDLTVQIPGKDGHAGGPVSFPLYLRIPSWCTHASVAVNGETVMAAPAAGGYCKLEKKWRPGDRIRLLLPMEIKTRLWTRNKNSVSVDYGPLTFSLKIDNRIVQKDSKKTAIGDSRWQEGADAASWPSYEIYPASAWNYGLVMEGGTGRPGQASSTGKRTDLFTLVEKPWPADDNPFTNEGAPIQIMAKGRQISSWTVDEYGLCGVLPLSPVVTESPLTELVLVPMGGARLRISAFPVVQGAADSVPATFSNPLLPSGPDPYSFYKDGYYYYTNTMGNRIDLWKTKNMSDLKTAQRKTIYRPPAGTGYFKDLWAPEVLFIDGKWYAYFAADSGNNNSHRLYVLENASADPMEGEWVFMGKISDASDKWAIDGDVFQFRNKWYLVWSGWEGDKNIQQNIYIAKMKNPWTIEGPRALISMPVYDWEKYGDLHGPNDLPHLNVNEGPQGLVHNGRLFIVYSASACWTDTYALGMLSFTGGDNLLDTTAWKKSAEPVFRQSPENGVYGTGHNSFFLSPDGTESWILYHANSLPGQGCGNTRSPRAQKFTWKTDGEPDFGIPVKDGAAMPLPSVQGGRKTNF